MSLINEAILFLKQLQQEGRLVHFEKRQREIESEIAATGTYTHTANELKWGARIAWRNSNRCVGRLFWEQLQVIDKRDAHTEEHVTEALFTHIEKATNGGKIRPMITIFKPGAVRIWNHQLIRYAGYDDKGDPLNRNFTSVCQKLGWQSVGSNYDVLPIVFQLSPESPPIMKVIPREIILEIPICHPDYPDVAKEGWKWYAVPIISDMALEIGGITYQAAPFNGWYMGTEIAARNFADKFRYNLLPKMAQIIGLGPEKRNDLWKDKAVIELNAAVLYSFKQAGVQIVDHHTATQQFINFEKKRAAFK